MNIIDAYNITRHLHAPEIDAEGAEDVIYRAIMLRCERPRLLKFCEAFGAGTQEFAKTNDLRAAIDVAVKVMEVN